MFASSETSENRENVAISSSTHSHKLQIKGQIFFNQQMQRELKLIKFATFVIQQTVKGGITR